MAVAITFDAVSHAYRDTAALDGIDLEVSAGERVAVVGASGAGKSTLLELICGLLSPSSGTVSAMPATLMPQRDLLLPWLSALDNAALPLRIRGLSRAAARERAAPLLARLGLAGFETSPPSELSGGMRQRVSLIRALLADAAILALDEPFASLDAITRGELHDWLSGALDAEPRTVVLVTHDVEEAVKLADRVLVLSARPGRIVADIPVRLPHPRHSTDPDLQALRATVLARLGVWPRRWPRWLRSWAPGSSTSISAGPIRSTSHLPTPWRRPCMTSGPSCSRTSG
jgi:ABC-type nitrate/sulfonate/bicarbonate transport system ATPase subunit